MWCPFRARLVVAIASDDKAAKVIVVQPVKEGGGSPFDLGVFRNARLPEIAGSFSCSDDLTLKTALKS